MAVYTNHRNAVHYILARHAADVTPRRFQDGPEGPVPYGKRIGRHALIIETAHPRPLLPQKVAVSDAMEAARRAGAGEVRARVRVRVCVCACARACTCVRGPGASRRHRSVQSV